MVGTWLSEICSCSCLAVLPDSGWVLLNKIYQPFFTSLYIGACAERRCCKQVGRVLKFYTHQFSVKQFRHEISFGSLAAAPVSAAVHVRVGPVLTTCFAPPLARRVGFVVVGGCGGGGCDGGAEQISPQNLVHALICVSKRAPRPWGVGGSQP